MIERISINLRGNLKGVASDPLLEKSLANVMLDREKNAIPRNMTGEINYFSGYQSIDAGHLCQSCGANIVWMFNDTDSGSSTDIPVTSLAVSSKTCLLHNHYGEKGTKCSCGGFFAVEKEVHFGRGIGRPSIVWCCSNHYDVLVVEPATGCDKCRAPSHIKLIPGEKIYLLGVHEKRK